MEAHVEGEVVHELAGPARLQPHQRGRHLCLVTVDGSTIECKTAEGTGTGHSWRVYTANRPSPLYSAVKTGYASPTVIQFGRTSVDAATGLTTSDFLTGGGEQVVVVGRNFGPALVAGKFTAMYRTVLTGMTAQSGAQLGGTIDVPLPQGSCTMRTSSSPTATPSASPKPPPARG